MGALRRDMLRRATGRTAELGSGTGLNLRYPDDLDELILTEPETALQLAGAARNPPARNVEVASTRYQPRREQTTSPPPPVGPAPRRSPPPHPRQARPPPRRTART